MHIKSILRIDKITTFGSLSAMSAHINRTRKTPNADPSKKKYNRTYIGTNDITVDFKKYIQDKNISKLRKNGVLVVEMLLTFSPSFLLNEDGKYRDDAKERLNKWIKLNRQWLNQKYGDRVINLTLHMDESTPHFHCILACSKRNKKGQWGLNTRYFFGGASKLSQLQTEYAAKMQPLGLQRGLKGSTASHKKVTNFYGALNNAEQICRSLNLSPPDKEPKALAQWTRGADRLAEALSADHTLRIRDLESKLNSANRQINELLHSRVDKYQQTLRPRR